MTVFGILESKFENAFVGGGKTLDMVLIANECLHYRLRDRVPGVMFVS